MALAPGGEKPIIGWHFSIDRSRHAWRSPGPVHAGKPTLLARLPGASGHPLRRQRAPGGADVTQWDSRRQSAHYRPGLPQDARNPFEGTVSPENIARFTGAGSEQVVTAARRAWRKCTMTAGLPNGYDSHDRRGRKPAFRRPAPARIAPARGQFKGNPAYRT